VPFTPLPTTDELTFHEVLAQGGMGVVRVATQVALGRRVATKMLHAATDDGQLASLVAEATVSAALDHPNVVPVYDLKRGPDGSPVLVMKLIDGSSWDALLHDGQPLDEAIRILIQVCNGVRFAHSRGIVHRDLKPANVMVGHYGEVYIVDWGLAVPPGPTADFAGTLAYAAPEMLRREDVTEQTDVYLLGGILFEILAGRPPHFHESVDDMMASILATPPPMPASAPEELARLARECLRANPAERPESALRVKEALETFLAHRGSMALTAGATKQLAELRARLEVSTERTEQVIELYAEIRFGFRQALAVWSENAAAKEGLAAAAKLMVTAALANGHVQTASILLKDLPAPEPELADRVARAVRASTERIASLQRLVRRHDPVTGSRTRLLAVLGFGALWSVAPIVGMLAGAAGTRAETAGGLPITLGLLVSGVLALRRAAALENEYEGRIARVVVVACALQIALTGGALALGVAPADVTSTRFAYWTVVVGIAAAAVEPMILPASAAFALAFIVSRALPELRFHVGTLANFAFSVNTGAIWWRRSRRDADRPSVTSRP
jgi:serine/threonine-protein kinase